MYESFIQVVLNSLLYCNMYQRLNWYTVISSSLYKCISHVVQLQFSIHNYKLSSTASI